MFQVTILGENSGQLIDNKLSIWMEAKSGVLEREGAPKEKDGRLHSATLTSLFAQS